MAKSAAGVSSPRADLGATCGRLASPRALLNIATSLALALLSIESYFKIPVFFLPPGVIKYFPLLDVFGVPLALPGILICI
jgi:hypothetical protein